jgi:hypothetical protein
VLEHYSHIRLAAKRRPLDGLVNRAGKPETAAQAGNDTNYVTTADSEQVKALEVTEL